jgi:5-methylcytosine-specific restriction endonuclease McrA
MSRLCRCGKIVKDRCDCTGKRTKPTGTTTQSGYDQAHRLASERYRAEHPLCERCVMLYGATGSKPSKDMHHIVSITKAPERRMERSNWLAVCRECHEDLEGDSMAGMAVKRWSEAGYEPTLEGAQGIRGYQNV